jgi:hypothetical protein
MFTEGSLEVHWMFTEYSLDIHWITIERSLHVHWMLIECSLDVHWMSIGCSLDIHWVFTEYSPNQMYNILQRYFDYRPVITPKSNFSFQRTDHVIRSRYRRRTIKRSPLFTGPLCHICVTPGAGAPAQVLHLCHTGSWSPCSGVTFVFIPFTSPAAQVLHLCHIQSWSTCSCVTVVSHPLSDPPAHVSQPSLAHPLSDPPAHVLHLCHTRSWSPCSCDTFVSHPELVPLLMCYSCVTP